MGRVKVTTVPGTKIEALRTVGSVRTWNGKYGRIHTLAKKKYLRIGRAIRRYYMRALDSLTLFTLTWRLRLIQDMKSQQ